MLPRRGLITVHCLLITFLFSCTPATPPFSQVTFYTLRIRPPTLLEFSPDLTTVTRELPLSFPPDCGLFDIYPPARGTLLAVELSCSFGQSVLFLDPSTGSVSPAFAEADSHFLAWTNDGAAAFLRVDSAGNPRIVRVSTLRQAPQENAGTSQGGAPLSAESISITELTYDLAPKPTGRDFTFTFSRGLGFGSEIWLAEQDGRIVQQLYADEFNYISFARWSLDGEQIAFIKIPDSQTPFTVGELWLMDADGSNARKLADADAGHGYAANWSPNGRQMAFVVRENPDEPRANESAEALISNIYLVDVGSNEVNQITNFTVGRAETPHWSPDGNKLAFQYVLNGRMDLQTVDLLSGEIKAILAEPACCPSWMRK